MTLPPSGPTPQPHSDNQRASGGAGGLVAASIVCGVIALAATTIWLLAMELTASALRPAELSSFPAYPGDVRPFQEAALARISVIVLVSFLAILALALAAIILGRRARRRSGNVAALARLGKWAAICLAVSLVGFGSILIFSLSSLPAVESFRMRLPTFVNQLLDIVLYRSPFIIQALVSVTAASAMGSFILSGVAVRFAHGQAIHRWRTRLSLVVSALILLGWFAITLFVARFIVGFYLHLVY
jgi:hypothetical protein